MLATEVAEERDARRPRCLIALVVLMTSIAFATTLPADAAATTIERCFLDKINEARADVGAAPLSWAPHIEDYTREHSEDMAGWGELIHSTGDALSAAIPPGWTSWGENIGWQSHPDLPDCSDMHQAFMDSTGHRNNLLNSSYRFAATGTHVDDGGLWTTHVFFANPSYVPGFDGTFADDDGSTFEADIEKIAQVGITSGCGGDNFCPNEIVTRGQMAAFLNRALGLPVGPDAGFLDVGGTFADDIDAIAYAQITQGCQPSLYCPGTRSPGRKWRCSWSGHSTFRRHPPLASPMRSDTSSKPRSTAWRRQVSHWVAEARATARMVS